MLTAIKETLSSAFDLSFEQTVPRSLVHKHSLENVFLTELKACGDDWFMCGARVPTMHRFFNEAGRSPSADILFYTELGRQASIAVSHAFFGVAHDQVFIFEQSDANLMEALWKSRDPVNPASIAIEIKVKEKETRRNGAVTRIVAEHAMYNGCEQVLQGTGGWSLQPQALFQRFRRISTRGSVAVNGHHGRELGMPPKRLGRDLTENVVISAPVSLGNGSESASSLIVDLEHPFFFDHPCDHVPGMLLLEGCAQCTTIAAAEAAGKAPEEVFLYAYDTQFTQFVECHLPVMLAAHVSPTWQDNDGILQTTVKIYISQQDVVSGTATMSVAFLGQHASRRR
jgi:2-oxo-3-(phosphooxy)propyl 3-oxoalkanoate synthase